MEAGERLKDCSDSVKIRWTPGHFGLEGNEVAGTIGAADRSYQREASFAHLTESSA